MSDLLSHLILNLRILKRIPSLLLHREKAISLASFKYLYDINSNDTLIIRFDFKNALWYKFDGIKTLSGRHIIVRNSTLNTEIPLTVQGIFRKRCYLIKLQPEAVFMIEIIPGINREIIQI